MMRRLTTTFFLALTMSGCGTIDLSNVLVCDDDRPMVASMWGGSLGFVSKLKASASTKRACP